MPDRTQRTAEQTRIDAIVDQVLEEQPVPGVAVAVVRRGEVVHQVCRGFADVENQRPVEPETIFRIGSVTKTFTALAIAQLWEQGRLELDDPLDRHLTSYRVDPPQGSPPITLRHLLTHRSGIGEVTSFGDLFRKGGRLWWPDGEPMPRMTEFYGEGFSAEVSVDTKWAYANHAFCVLGQVVEDVSGELFEDYVRDHLFTPLGMHDSEVLLEPRLRERLAVGYKTPKEGKPHPKPVEFRQIFTPPAGSIFSPVTDMARYAQAMLGGGANDHGRVVEADTLKHLFAPHWELDPRLGFKQGLGFMLDHREGARLVHHGGAWPGFISLMMLAPDEDLGVVAFTNAIAMIPLLICRRIIEDLLELPDPLAELPVPGVADRPELHHELVGAWGARPGLKTNSRFLQAFGGQIEVVDRNGQLHLRGLIGPNAKPIRLYPVDPDDPLVFIAARDVRGTRMPLKVAFVRGSDGRVDQLNVDAMTPLQVYRRPASRNLRRLGRGAAATATLGAATALRRARGRRTMAEA